MTDRPTHQPPAANTDGRFPDFPGRGDRQGMIHIHDHGFLPMLALHFGNEETTFILSEVPVARNPGNLEGLHISDLLIVFNTDPAAIMAQMGYSIDDRGKPPDFLLEIAWAHNPNWPGLSEWPELPDLLNHPEIEARCLSNDYAGRRQDYAALGIPEYWRFDPSGGERFDAPLAGDRLVNGAYQPIAISHRGEQRYWGHSAALNLDLCWEYGHLRWWDPAAREYIPTIQQAWDTERARANEAEGRIAERRARQAAEARADREQEARIAAEARVRELEKELLRRQQS